MRRLLRRAPELALWLLLALPALYQLALLATAIAGRVGYPYDLEWMEGGMLHHALRIRSGEGIYVPPSIDFIPYLYTPLYPTLLALFGSAFGLTYTLGRMFSIIGLVGIAVVGWASFAAQRNGHARRGPVLVGLALSLGLFAACYPFVEGWYDLVRADTFFLFMVTAGIAGLPRWATLRTGLAGQAQVAAGAAVMALAFFCKQTGIIYVAWGGVIVAVLGWRRAPVYSAVAGAIGLGGVWMMNSTSHGWFWIYVQKIHQAHDFNMDRFWKSFGYILLHFRALTAVVGGGLVAVVATAIKNARARHRPLVPRATHPFLLWSATFAVSTIVGAIGWGTEFAHFNAYMPAFLHGALAAGAAVPALAGCAREWAGEHRHRELVATAAAMAAALPLAITCWIARWDPQPFIPRPSDVAAGDRLIAHLASIDGDVWMPSHPWYVYLAGKTPHVHRMGVKDVTTRPVHSVQGLVSLDVEGLSDALQHHAFAAIVLDDRDLQLELPQLRQSYRPALVLPNDERPRVFTGARVVPDTIWVPAVRPTPPAGARVVFDFEAAAWAGWTASGSAWGNGPTAEPLPGEGLVLGATGARFATSMHGGDSAVGRVTSPTFVLDGTRLTMQLGGGTDASKLRVELWVDDQLVRTASVPEPGGPSLRLVSVDLAGLAGASARLVLVDDATTGHLDVDDVWIWQAP